MAVMNGDYLERLHWIRESTMISLQDYSKKKTGFSSNITLAYESAAWFYQKLDRHTVKCDYLPLILQTCYVILVDRSLCLHYDS